MVNVTQKTPLADSLNLLAQQKTLDAIVQLGKALPATVTAVQGSIVTVSFPIQSGWSLPNITCAVANSQWMRPPIQVGDAGIVVPADVVLAGITGLGGGGTATFAPVGKLSNVVFVPIANVAWQMDDAGKALINGPTGVILRTQDKAVTFTLDETSVTITGGGGALALVTSALVDFFNSHTHPGNGEPPSQQMSSAQLTTVLAAQ